MTEQELNNLSEEEFEIVLAAKVKEAQDRAERLN